MPLPENLLLYFGKTQGFNHFERNHSMSQRHLFKYGVSSFSSYAPLLRNYMYLPLLLKSADCTRSKFKSEFIRLWTNSVSQVLNWCTYIDFWFPPPTLDGSPSPCKLFSFSFYFWMMFLLGQTFPQFSLISSHSETLGYDVSALILGPSSPEEGPSIRAETSYPKVSEWLEMRENCGKVFILILHFIF